MAPPGFPSDIESIETAIRQVPIMFMDSRLRDGLSYVGTNRQSVAIMVDYLCRSGDPPALITMPAVNANVLERHAACSERMLELGHEPRILNPEDGPIGDDYERYGYERFLGLPPERMAGVNTILRPNDRIAFGRLAAAKRLGGSGPSAQPRTASHDGQRIGALRRPPSPLQLRTSVPSAMVVASALVGLGQGGELPKDDILLDGTLIFRDSA